MNDDTPRKPIIDLMYRRYLVDEDTAAFIKQVSKSYSVASLEKLVEFGNRESRRAAVLAVGFLGDYTSNHPVGCALTDEDRGVRMLAENAIRSIWCRVGSKQQQNELAKIIRLNTNKQFDEAIQKSNQLLEALPWFAEAYNQRAIAYFSLKHYPESIQDCHQALEINPYHFGAATGMAYCYVQIGDTQYALESFQRALRLNPSLEPVRAEILRLKREQKKREEK